MHVLQGLYGACLLVLSVTLSYPCVLSITFLCVLCRFSESSCADGLGVISMEPVFSEGGVFSSSLCTSTLAQSFYNKDVLPILGALLSARLTNFAGRSSVGEVQLIQVEIPQALQVSDSVHGLGERLLSHLDNCFPSQNKPYQELFEQFMRPTNKAAAFGALPLGLYRRHDGMGESHWLDFPPWSANRAVYSYILFLGFRCCLRIT